MQADVVVLLDEIQCQELEEFLAQRIYEFNAEATGHRDGRLLAASIRGEDGEIIGGFSGYTWGGSCGISYLWVSERHRGRGLGKTLLKTAETQALSRGCKNVVLLTHSFQAPGFYVRLGYEKKYAIEGRPEGYSDIVFVKQFEH